MAVETPHFQFPFQRPPITYVLMDGGPPTRTATKTVDGGNTVAPTQTLVADAGSPRPACGQVSVVEQDTVEHIMSCETVIASYPVGYRHDRPEFGWAWPDLTTYPIDTSGLEQALKQFEPRGKATVVDQYLDAMVAASVHVDVEVEIAAVELKD